eukprot:TRINITY_DN7290_c0_g1_i2.p1 TRINITY_DN7290_c0_g1~~TRINITY_DN7290_c0_g1_i2.p1  ORF type:complete len:117 (-),score=25.42 TRINITY_DN7290_c0_g1_i2:254-604(-)
MPLAGGFGTPVATAPPGYVAVRPLQGSPQQPLYHNAASSPLYGHTPNPVGATPLGYASPLMGGGFGSPSLQHQQRPAAVISGGGSPSLLQPSFAQSPTTIKAQPAKDDPFANLVKF